MSKQKDPTTPIGERVRSARLEKHWTQDDVARVAKVPRQAVTDIEVGPESRRLDIVRTHAIAKALDIPFLVLVSLALPGQIDPLLIEPNGLAPNELELILNVRGLSPLLRRLVERFVEQAKAAERDGTPAPPLLGPEPVPPHRR